MKARLTESFLSKLDSSVRWTGIPARVADEMSDAPSVDRKHRPLRWMPIWPIVFSCALPVLSFNWQSLFVVSLAGIIPGFLPVIHILGPLGRPSYEDDEREAALRRASFLFCFGLVACLNFAGQPILMILSHLQSWPLGRVVSVAISALILNVTLFGTLPTLYASWNSRQLPND